MTLDELITSFLTYLETSNALRKEPFEHARLDQQARDFRKAMIYAEKSFAKLLNNPIKAQDIIKLLKGIHQRCSTEAYSIATVTKRSGIRLPEIDETVGTIRQLDLLGPKTIPIIDIENPKDLAFLRRDLMPRVIDARLKLMHLNPEKMSVRDKEKAMNGQPAWMNMNDILQISPYIYTHLGAKANYYFLCAYYREHILTMSPEEAEKYQLNNGKLLADIHKLSKEVKLSFDDNRRTLNSKEKQAYGIVYVTHPPAAQVGDLFEAYARDLAHQINSLDFRNVDELATFYLQTFQAYLDIHPFFDANHRTFNILFNAILNHYGYDYINFYTQRFNALKLHFNTYELNTAAATKVLTSAFSAAKLTYAAREIEKQITAYQSKDHEDANPLGPLLIPDLQFTLSELYQQLGDYPLAEKKCTLALGTYRRLKAHPETIKALKHLALMYRKQHKDDQAQIKLEKAIEICEALESQLLSNEQKESCLSIFRELATIYADRKEYVQMHALLKKAQPYYPQSEPSSPFEIPTTLRDLGDAYFGAESYIEAKKHYEVALKTCKDILQLISPDWSSYADITALVADLSIKLDKTLIKLGECPDVGFCNNPYGSGNRYPIFSIATTPAPIFIPQANLTTSVPLLDR